MQVTLIINCCSFCTYFAFCNQRIKSSLIFYCLTQIEKCNYYHLHCYRTAVLCCILNHSLSHKCELLPYQYGLVHHYASKKVNNSRQWMFSLYCIAVNNMFSLLNTSYHCLYLKFLKSRVFIHDIVFTIKIIVGRIPNAVSTYANNEATFWHCNFIFNWRMPEKWTQSLLLWHSVSFH